MQMQDRYFDLDLSPGQIQLLKSNFSRSKSCLEHYAINFNFPLNFVPALKPKSFLYSPSPMVLGKKDGPVINSDDNMSLYDNIKCHSDEEDAKIKKTIKKLKKQMGTSKDNCLISNKIESEKMKKFKSNMALLQISTDDHQLSIKKNSDPQSSQGAHMRKSKFNSSENENVNNDISKVETSSNTPDSPRKSILLHLENKRKSSTCNVLSDL